MSDFTLRDDHILDEEKFEEINENNPYEEELDDDTSEVFSMMDSFNSEEWN